MANKKITRADTETMYSFVLPRGDARNKEASREAVAAFLAPKRPAKPVASLHPTLDAINAMKRPGLTEVYSDGHRNYASLEDMKRANPNMPSISNPSSSTGNDPGRSAEQLGKAIEYSKDAHDMFGAIAEAGGGGEVAKRALAPVGYLLDGVGAGARFIAGDRRGEPIDVAAMRAVAPWAGSALGGTLGSAGGAALGAVAGLEIPVIGNVAGAVVGGIGGGIYGSRKGSELGEDGAEAYARMRRYGEW